MKYFIVLLVFLNSLNLFARDFKVLDLNDVKIGYRNYIYSRDPMFLDSVPKEQLNIGFDTDLLKYGYWNALVHGTTNDAQYKRIGLQMEIGIRIFNNLEFTYKHHSQHLLDSVYPYQKFPCEDSWGIYLYLFRKEQKNSIF